MKNLTDSTLRTRRLRVKHTMIIAFFLIIFISFSSLFYNKINELEKRKEEIKIEQEETLQINRELRSEIKLLERRVDILENELEQQQISEEISPQLRIDLTEKEIDLFYELIMAEFGNTSKEAQKMGASTVINRILSEKFPDTFTGVLYQKNAFSVIFDGSWGRWEITESVKEAVNTALEKDYSNGSLFFLNVELAKEQGYGHNADKMLKTYQYVTEIDNVTFLK